MNRVTAILLAVLALLVHMLAIYRDSSGAFGLPYESAHVAYRLGRNLARDGVLAFDLASGAGGLESYPSPLWIGVAWLAERLLWTVTKTAQLTGILCTLATVVISTRFDRDRIAGVVPALLLVSCGALAIGGPSGTEWPAVTLALVTAFVAQEKGRRNVLAFALTALVASRPESVILVVVLFSQAWTGRKHGFWVVYIPAVVLIALLELSGARYFALLGDALTPSAERAAEGFRGLFDFARMTVSPVLLVFPLAALAAGRLSAVGRRSLALGLVWVLIVTLESGGPWAYRLAYVPALPLLFISVQQGIARALDTYIRALERIAWASIAATIAASILVSRFPGDLGPIRLTTFYERWLAPAAEPPPGHEPAIGRAALYHEILLSRETRRVGRFVRDDLPAGSSVLTPWPGAIGYLSKARVIDLYGRTTPLGEGEVQPWWPVRRDARLLAGLALDPDYILPGIPPRRPRDEVEPASLVETWIDLAGATRDADEAAVRAALERYELVVCPMGHAVPEAERTPVHILRRIDPAAWPELSLAREGNVLRVEARAPAVGPPLLARLELEVERSDGRKAWIVPGGALETSGPRVARSAFELRPGTGVALWLGEYELPEDARSVEARLLLPALRAPHDRMPLGRPARLDW